MKIRLPPVLLIDDEKNMRLSLASVLEGEGYKVRAAENAEQGLALLGASPFLMVITDAQLGGMSGYDFLRHASQAYPGLPVLMITAYATPRLAVEAIRAGAIDYISKPFDPEELLHAVARCAERYRLIQENATLRKRSGDAISLDQIVGECPKVRELRQMVQTVAASHATVLILGESGTGKELIAGALHHLSPRKDANYVRLNCAAIPEQLLESELFGHERGAFTGAVQQKAGRVEDADGGTIFLDEIGDMSRPLQAKLLRFLEDGSFTRVGGVLELRVDVRLIAATNRDIVQAIRANEFREDLFHRLNVVQLSAPPLRERGSDILLLADHYLRHFTAVVNKPIRDISPLARQKLDRHHWPGNVRELRNVIERAVILETTSQLQPSSLPDFDFEIGLRRPDGPKPVSGKSLDEQLAAFERELITSTLEQCRYSLTRTADTLHISRHALRYRMHRLNLSVEGETDTGEAPDPAPTR